MIHAKPKSDDEKFNLSNFEWNDDTYKANVIEFLKRLAFLIESTVELKECFNIYNGVFQIKVQDDKFNFWVKAHEGELDYQLGTFKNPSIELILTKSTLLKIAKKELNGIEAYMKGLVLIRGNLIHLYNMDNCMRLIYEYIENSR